MIDIVVAIAERLSESFIDEERLIDVVVARSIKLRHKIDGKRAGRLVTAVLRAAERFDVRPALILAVIEAESAYHVGATSTAACRGLMQLNPNTAPSVAGSIKMSYYDLGNIEHNIALGVAYLRQLFNMYGRWDFALTAYNKGPGAFGRQGCVVGNYAIKILKKQRVLALLIK